MKAIFLKLLLAGLLAVVLLALAPQVLPLAHQASSPPETPKVKPVLPPPGVKYLDQVEDLVFELTNKERQARGVAPLIKDEELRQLARAYSNDMLVRRFFDHTNPDGVPFEERITDQYNHRVFLIGENIWYSSGYHYSRVQQLAREIVDDWMNSPGHRENLLRPAFTHLGVGVSARQQSIRATQEFVRRPWFFWW